MPTPADPWLDDLAEGVVLVDGARVRYLNRAAAALLDVDAERSRGLPIIAVLRDHRLERVVTEREPVEIDTRGRRVFAVPIVGGLALRDVTEQRRSQQGARDLLAVLSHELRTPATTIRSTLEALRYDLPVEQRRRFVARAEAETDRLIRLLEDLTVESRPPRLRRLTLADLVARAELILRPLLEEHRVRLATSLASTTVLADEDKLLQVMINLIENAALHGPDDAVVEVAVQPLREGWLALSVDDRGEPLPAETFEGLFAPHTRGGAASAKGTGLGLYIVRTIVRQWGGDAYAHALEGGNRFVVTVPLPPP